MSARCLHILWVNDNPVSAENMVFLYATNSLLKGWWEEVHLIVWGASTKLLCEDANMQQLLKKFLDAGGQVSVCKRCAENINVYTQIVDLVGTDSVYYVGESVTKLIKDGEKMLTV